MSSPSSSHNTQEDSRLHRFRRPPDLDQELFGEQDVENAIPSPPYRRVPSTSHVLLDTYPEQSPAYRSRSNLDLSSGDMPEDSPVDEKRPDHGSKGKHAVHYPEELPQPLSAPRFEPEFRPASRASSIATDEDDDDEDYDWSGEEDLVDEEAKFEHAMGVKKKERKFGCIKCVAMRLEYQTASSRLYSPLPHRL